MTNKQVKKELQEDDGGLQSDHSNVIIGQEVPKLLVK